jgi:hypothetical protein
LSAILLIFFLFMFRQILQIHRGYLQKFINLKMNILLDLLTTTLYCFFTGG